MTINSGSQFRSFASQKDFSFVFECVNSSSLGFSEIGFSGESGKLPLFTFASGNITDFNNKNVWYYSPREIINFSGNIGNGALNYFINNKPICLFSPDSKNYFYDTFYISTNSEIEYSFYIKGDVPNYQFAFPNEILYGKDITGFILNIENTKNKTFQIFSGDIFSETFNYNFSFLPNSKISGNESKAIVLNPIITSLNNIEEQSEVNLNLLFQTNFGQINYSYNFNLFPAPIYYLDIITGFTGTLGFIEDRTFSKNYNYTIQSLSPENRNIEISLENISGHTGELKYEQFEISGFASGILKGAVYGYDYITGIISGTGIGWGGIVDYYGNSVTGNFFQYNQQLKYATGNIDYYYNLPLFGGSGTGQSPNGFVITGSGILISRVSGFVFGSGFFENSTVIDLTGYYYESPNIREGFQKITNNSNYSGRYAIEYNKLLWESKSITGQNFIGNSNLIVTLSSGVIAGFTNDGKTGLNSTVFNELVKTGLLLTPVIKENNELFNLSGKSFSSESDNISAQNAFTGDNYFYLTGLTGAIGFEFLNYTTQNKGRISYYSFELDFYSLKYPYIFDLQLSINNSNWITIDSRTGQNFLLRNDPLNFYSYPKEIFLPCQFSNQLLNTTSQYQYARLNIRSGVNWPHNFYENKSSSGIGFKKIKFYNNLPIGINNSEFFSRYQVVPNLTGYNHPSGNILNDNSFSGNVIYSKDSNTYPAWQAFNKNKNLYPYAEISGNNNNEIYIGYSIDSGLFNLSGFSIEFEPNFKPHSIALDYSIDGLLYERVYELYQNIPNVLTAFRQDIPLECKSVKFVFNVSSSSSTTAPICNATPPPGVNVNGSCYLSVITIDTVCCDNFWDDLCQSNYDQCIAAGGDSSSSSSSSSSTFFINDPFLWFDPSDENTINPIIISSSSSSSTQGLCFATPAPQYNVNLNSNCYLFTIQEDSFCCDTLWDDSCQNKYLNWQSVSCQSSSPTPEIKSIWLSVIDDNI